MADVPRSQAAEARLRLAQAEAERAAVAAKREDCARRTSIPGSQAAEARARLAQAAISEATPPAAAPVRRISIEGSQAADARERLKRCTAPPPPADQAPISDLGHGWESTASSVQTVGPSAEGRPAVVADIQQFGGAKDERLDEIPFNRLSEYMRGHNVDPGIARDKYKLVEAAQRAGLDLRPLLDTVRQEDEFEYPDESHLVPEGAPVQVLRAASPAFFMWLLLHMKDNGAEVDKLTTHDWVHGPNTRYDRDAFGPFGYGEPPVAWCIRALTKLGQTSLYHFITSHPKGEWLRAKLAKPPPEGFGPDWRTLCFGIATVRISHVHDVSPAASSHLTVSSSLRVPGDDFALLGHERERPDRVPATAPARLLCVE